MKIAILGSSPLCLEAVLRFHSHDAAVTWFSDRDEEIFPPHFTRSEWSTTTSELGWALLSKKQTGAFSDEAWYSQYLNPLTDVLKSTQEIKPYKVLSITKRFLIPDEVPQNSSRFYDLFRIIYQLNPSQFVEKHKESDPEMYTRLSTEMMESLQSTLEMYDDFDLVLDLRRPREPLSINETGRAMGESRVSREQVSKGLSILSELPSLMQNKEIREMILIGSTELAIEVMVGLRDWIHNPANRLFVATTESIPFEKILPALNPTLREAFENLMAEIQENWEAETEIFHTKLREWQALDDFVQAKIPKPVEPIPQVNFFSGHNVSAIDQLIDRKRLFLTLEKPEFREGKWHPENNILGLKTLGVDHVLVATRLIKPSIELLDSEEKGYFSLIPSSSNFKDGWKKDSEILKGIENEIFKLFSPATSS